jgi:hypothetical protein
VSNIKRYNDKLRDRKVRRQNPRSRSPQANRKGRKNTDTSTKEVIDVSRSPCTCVSKDDTKTDASGSEQLHSRDTLDSLPATVPSASGQSSTFAHTAGFAPPDTSFDLAHPMECVCKLCMADFLSAQN